MLVMRLQRVGRRNRASFRIIVTEHSRAPQSGRYVEMVGWWDPHKDVVEVKEERVRYWLSVGAQASDTVYNLLVDQGVVQGKKRNVLPRKRPLTQNADDTLLPSSTNETDGEEGGGGESAEGEAA